MERGWRLVPDIGNSLIERKKVKYLAIALLMVAGATGLLAISQFSKMSDFNVGSIFGTLIIPALLGWWGLIALSKQKTGATPTPDTHVKCPDCRELVLKDARVCKHCGCKLTPQ
ncbi:MAG TPA: hypothetical protein VN283_06140 [Thiobacillus sp.]|nr:hypothetical protein [Thiobacillus sp.]